MTGTTLVTQKISTEGADLLTLAGVNDANLIELGRIHGVRVGMRGESITLAGDPSSVDRAMHTAQRMVEAARQRASFTADDVLRMSEDTNGDSGPLDPSRLALPGIKRVVQAKTPGQAEYLQKIADHDIVIGIGPAGTGKTYLAVAAAVDALMRKRVKRIVLDEARRWGSRLPDDRIIEIYGHDIELNAQGLGSWLDTLQ